VAADSDIPIMPKKFVHISVPARSDAPDDDPVASAPSPSSLAAIVDDDDRIFRRCDITSSQMDRPSTDNTLHSSRSSDISISS
jgi:hypothetical protein